MARDPIISRILSEVTPEEKQFVRLYAQIVLRIQYLMDKKGWTQKDLARKLGKAPPEISKWLRGDHNFTVQTIIKLQVELGEDILFVPMPASQKAASEEVQFVSSASFEAETRHRNVQPGASPAQYGGKVVAMPIRDYSYGNVGS